MFCYIKKFFKRKPKSKDKRILLAERIAENPDKVEKYWSSESCFKIDIFKGSLRLNIAYYCRSNCTSIYVWDASIQEMLFHHYYDSLNRKIIKAIGYTEELKHQRYSHKMGLNPQQQLIKQKLREYLKEE